MNNFNLYLDDLVDQGYDITLMKYYFEWFYISEHKYLDELGIGFSYSDYNNNGESGAGYEYEDNYQYTYNSPRYHALGCGYSFQNPPTTGIGWVYD